MKTEMTITVELDLPKDISQENIQESVLATAGLYLHLIDKTVPATVTAVDIKEIYDTTN